MKREAHQDRVRTIRQQMIALLSEREMNAREISQAIGIREREAYDHLPHIARSTASQGKMLIVHPARCLACGYVFQHRKRLTRPGRCPRCKRSHLQEPTYRVG
jgi:predicted Zn-ribbon and HTH transcriptional regulator